MGKVKLREYIRAAKELGYEDMFPGVIEMIRDAHDEIEIGRIMADCRNGRMRHRDNTMFA